MFENDLRENNDDGKVSGKSGFVYFYEQIIHESGRW